MPKKTLAQAKAALARARQSGRVNRVLRNTAARRPVTQPVRGTKIRAPYTLTGTELMDTIVLGSGVPPGTKLYGNIIAPSSIGTRLPVLNSLFEKYQINRLTFRLKSVGSLISDCAVIMAFDTDAGDKDPSEDVSGLAAMQVWNHHTFASHLSPVGKDLVVTLQQPDSGFYTSFDVAGDFRLSYCGQLYVYVMTPPSSGDITWILQCDYSVTFFEPQIGDTNGLTFGNWEAGPVPSTNAYHYFNSITTDVLKQITAVTGVSAAYDSDQHRYFRFEPGLWQIHNYGSVSGGTLTDQHVDYDVKFYGEHADDCTHSTIMQSPGASPGLASALITNLKIAVGCYAIVKATFSLIGSLSDVYYSMYAIMHPLYPGPAYGWV